MGATLVGVEGVAVEVEVRASAQLPRIEIVGLPEAAVRESAARVRAAISAAGQKIPDRRLTVNLAPAALRKHGAGLDLPIAMGILAAAGALETSSLECLGLVGELALDGRLRPIRGALAMALALRDAGCRLAIFSVQNAPEAALATGLEVLAAENLSGVIQHFLTGECLSVAAPMPPLRNAAEGILDIADVRGQDHAKRAVLIAAAGRHPLLLRGAPGSGKTMLARRLTGLLPPLHEQQALEVTQIQGSVGDPIRGLAQHPPFRAPHHSASVAGLLGGGNPLRPGEVSLAHQGVLFLDELPEFGRRCLESLRQVVEERRVSISRADTRCELPADFHLVAAANPCPCGWLGSGRRDCRCDDGAVARYAARISGPLLDRFDLHANVRPVPWGALKGAQNGPPSERLRERVIEARDRQARRSDRPNGRLSEPEIDSCVRADSDALQLLGRAVDRFGLSARCARRTLCVARSIADLAGEERTDAPAVAEALGYRSELDDSR